ncbi:MAG: ABC transporter permease [Pseudomonadota bacterium]
MLTIAARELRAYFGSPIALVLLIVFPAAAGALPIFVDDFFAREQADLGGFFRFHPWLYLIFVPAMAMRMWSEEKRDGTFELLMTLPISTTASVLGKFLAAWIFALLALLLTTPMWATVNYLGEPDNFVIAVGYVGSWLVAGAFLSVSAAASTLSDNQVVAFFLAIASCFLFIACGLSPVLSATQNWGSPLLAEIVSGFSMEHQFTQFSQGLMTLPGLILIATLIVGGLSINVWLVEMQRT